MLNVDTAPVPVLLFLPDSGTISGMKTLVTILTFVSALLSFVALLRPPDTARALFSWLPKLLGGALAPILGIVSGIGALFGLARRDARLATTGIVGAGLATRLLSDVACARGDFADAFGPDWRDRLHVPWRGRMRSRRITLVARRPDPTVIHYGVPYGQSASTGDDLVADVWQPAAGTPRTGLGLVYVHGGGWRIGEKDQFTRPFFRRLAGQGHVVLDIDYTLWPRAGIPDMVSEVKQAVLWMKGRGASYGVDPERVVLAGGSAGGHLALLAAYTADHPQFPPPVAGADTTVRGVVAFYPPADFQALSQDLDRIRQAAGWVEEAAEAALDRVFKLRAGDLGFELRSRDLLPAILGGEPDEVSDAYRLLSPIHHTGAHCPPTLLLQGSDDIFLLAPAVRQLYDRLRQAGVPAVLVEFPHTEHAFDLVLPRLSPTAQASTYDIERFLALLS